MFTFVAAILGITSWSVPSPLSMPSASIIALQLGDKLQSKVLELEAERERLASNRRFADALAVAIQVVDFYRREAPASSQLPVALTAAGRIATSLGKYSLANSYFQEAAIALEVAGSRVTPAGLQLHGEWGYSSYLQGKFEAAFDHWKVAAGIAENLKKSPESLADLYSNVGLAAYEARKYPLAREWYQKAMSIHRASGAVSLRLGSLLNDLGLVALQMSEPAVARTYLQEAATIRDDLGAPGLHRAYTYANLGAAFIQLGDLDSAELWCQRGLQLRIALAPDSLQVAGSFQSLGVIQMERGALDRAEQYYLKALAIKERLGPSSMDLAMTLNNLGNLSLERGDLDAAEYWHSRAITLKEKIAPGSLSLALSYENVAGIALQCGDYSRAVVLLNRGLAIKTELMVGQSEFAKTYNSLGAVYILQGMFDRAESLLMNALDIRSKIQADSIQHAAVFQNLGELDQSRGRYLVAAKWYARSLAIGKKRAPLSLETAKASSSIGSYLLRCGDLAGAKRLFEESESIIDYQRKLVATPRMRALISRQHFAFLPPYAKCLIQLKRLEDAIRVIERVKSRGLADEMRVTTERTSIKASEIVYRLRKAYEEVALATDEADMARLSAGIRELEGQRRIEEEAEVRKSVVGREGDQSVKMNVEDIGKLLGSSAILLHYVVGEKFTLCIVVRGSESGLSPTTAAFMVAVGERDLRLKRDALLAELRGPNLMNRASSVNRAPMKLGGKRSYELYRLLLKPVEAQFMDARVKRMVISPNGPLNTLPFGALVMKDGANPTYLADVRPVTMVPSLSVLRLLRERKGVAAPVPIAVFGDPYYGDDRSGGHEKRSDSIGVEHPWSASREGTRASAKGVMDRLLRRGLRLSRLPESRLEATTIAALYNSKALLGRSATVAAIRSHSSHARILHFACHGILDLGNPLASALAVSSTETEDGFLQGFEVLQDLKLCADMVVLSACETGLGKEEGNEGVNGLSKAFLLAGARSVVVSLWSVADESTSRFMVYFYRSLRAGRPKDVALQEAMVKLKSNPRWAHPFYWAPFVLSGDYL